MATVKVNGVDVSTGYTPEEWAGISLRFEAFDGQVGQGSLPIPDPAGTSVPYAGYSCQFIGLGPLTLFDGFVGALQRERGVTAAGTRRLDTYTIGDENAVLHGFRAYKWRRPVESTRARFLAFLAAFVPWVTDTTWVTSAVTASMPKKTYTTETLFDELFAEIRDLTGNTAFIENHRAHLHPVTNGDTGGLAFSDTGFDFSTTFPLYSPRRSKDDLDLRNDVLVTTPNGSARATDATAIARYNVGGLKHQALVDLPSGTRAEAAAKAAQILADSKAERIMYEFDTGPMTAAQLASIPVGSLVSVTSAVMGLSGSTQRIAAMTVSYVHPDRYKAHIEMSFPIRVRRAAPRIARVVRAEPQTVILPSGACETNLTIDDFARSVANPNWGTAVPFGQAWVVTPVTDGIGAPHGSPSSVTVLVGGGVGQFNPHVTASPAADTNPYPGHGAATGNVLPLPDLDFQELQLSGHVKMTASLPDTGGSGPAGPPTPPQPQALIYFDMRIWDPSGTRQVRIRAETSESAVSHGGAVTSQTLVYVSDNAVGNVGYGPGIVWSSGLLAVVDPLEFDWSIDRSQGRGTISVTVSGFGTFSAPIAADGAIIDPLELNIGMSASQRNITTADWTPTIEFSNLAGCWSAPLTANTNNWNPMGIDTASFMRVSTDASRNLTGIVAPAVAQTLILANVGTFPLVLKHDTTSTAGNRFLLPNNADLTLPPNAAVVLVYDPISAYWRVESLGAAGGSMTVELLDATGVVTGVTTLRAAALFDHGGGDVDLLPQITGPAGNGVFDTSAGRPRVLYPDAVTPTDGLDVAAGATQLFSEHTPGDLADAGPLIEAGVDYVGVRFGEKDAGTVQIYPDVAGGYDVELVDRGWGKHWITRDEAGTLSSPLAKLHNFLTGTADPTAGGGVAHPQPAIYLRDNAGTTEIWTPTGAGATAWQKVTIP